MKKRDIERERCACIRIDRYMYTHPFVYVLQACEYVETKNGGRGGIQREQKKQMTQA